MKCEKAPVCDSKLVRRQSGRLAVLIGALMLLLLPVSAQAQGAISGTVTDAVSGAGVNGSVGIYAWNGSQIASVGTSATGAYSFTGLPAGFYFARTFVAPTVSYVDEAYDDVLCLTCPITTTTPIVVTNGGTATVNFALSPGGSISGTVTDAATGATLSGMFVVVATSTGTFVKSASSDGSGVWIVRGLPAGIYYARTSLSTTGIYLDEAFNNIACAPSCPNVTTTTPITVSGAATTPGINFTLSSGGGFSGRVTDAPSGTGIANVQLSILNSTGSTVRFAFTNATGDYSVAGLLPGTYYARTFVQTADIHIDEAYGNFPCVPCPSPITTTAPIAVGAGTTTGIDFPLSPGGSITGTIFANGTAALLANVSVSVVNSAGLSVRSGFSNAAGVYTVNGLLPGTYYMRTFVSSTINYIDEAYGDVPCVPCPTLTSTTPIPVGGTATTPNIHFGLSPGGTIAGNVVDARTNAPGPGINIQILNSTGGFVKSGSANSAGVYTVTGLPAGTYYARTSSSNLYNAELYNNIACPHLSCVLTSGTPIDAAVGAQSVANFALTPAGASDIVTDFGPGSGVWMLTSENRWQGLHGLSPVGMVTGDLNGNGRDDLVVNFGPGVGVWVWADHSQWVFLHASSPSKMVTGDLNNNGTDEVIFVFPGAGVWRWSDGVWNQVHGADAANLAVGRIDTVAGDDLVLDFPGYGLWMLANNTTWSSVHGLSATTLLTADINGNGRDDIVVVFAGHGLWVFRDNATWANLHALSPARVAAGYLDTNSSKDLVVDFGPGIGLWTLRNGVTWANIHGFSSQGIVLADRDVNLVDEVIIDFGPGIGIWQLANNNLNTWSALHSVSPEESLTGRFR